MPATKEVPATANGAAKGESAASAPASPPADVARAGGFKAWLPLVVTFVAMPALAYALTTLVLLPKLKAAINATAPSEAAESAGAGEEKGSKSEGSRPEKSGSEGHGAKGGKFNYPFGKVLVNISGSQGTRYLLTTFTLAGAGADFKTKIEENKDHLVDLASGTLSTKTIADLEKPGMRNLIRSELISVFNNALGKGVVQEIYFTEFAIQ